MQYFFILGRIPELSIVELLKFALFHEGKSFKVKEASEKFIILETEQKIDLSFWQKQLGGIVKCGEIIKEIKEFKEEEVKEILLRESGPTKVGSKIFFGLSFYFLTKKVSFNEIKNYSLSLKKIFREEGISASFILPKEKPFLSTAAIIKVNY